MTLCHRRMSRLFLVLVIAVMLLAIQYTLVSGQMLTAPAKVGAAIVVNSTLDVVADEGVCTLREAITAANTDTTSGTVGGECVAGNGADTITLSPGTYTLSLPGGGEDANATGDLDIDSDITVQGSPDAATVIDGAALDRVFHVLPGGRLRLENLTVRGGQTTNGSGGGIYHAGELLVLINSMVVQNRASGGFPNGRGGGVWSSGVMTLTRSTIDDNVADRDGGGIYNAGEIWLVDSFLTNNTADLNGGGAYNGAGTLRATNSVISGNLTVFSGGGVNNRGSLYLTGSLVEQNVTDLSGGGVFNSSGGDVHLLDTTLSRNEAQEGGGLYTRDGVLSIMGSTLVGNTAVSGGSLYTRDNQTTLANSTVSGNTATVKGGGIFNESVSSAAVVDLAHVSLVGNQAAVSGSSLAMTGTAVITLTNSLLTIPGVVAHCDGNGTIVSAGYNLASDASCNLTGSADQVVTTPLVDDLADNGGATMTHALLADSLALDYIPEGESGCGTSWVLDQRGVTRPQDSGCDVGAYESDSRITAVYLPVVIRAEDVLIAPDLIVSDIQVTASSVQIVIANQGTGAVTTPFWVDLYINPDPAPTEVNQTWDQLSTEGLVWGVVDTSSLTPDGTLTLVLNDANFDAELSDFSGTFSSGMEIYVQVDSANQARGSGGVLETHEILDQPYNNIAHITVSLP